MIACDVCTVWHHAECAGLEATCEEELPSTFVCPRCKQLDEGDALAEAEDEGLTLVRADNVTGFRNVTHSGKHIAGKPFKAGVIQDGREKWLGRFVTAAEAALAVARLRQMQDLDQSLRIPNS